MCSLITRDPATNQISVITSQPLNIIGQTASGIDVDATYNFPVGPGDLTLRAMASFVDKLETTVTSEGHEDRRQGRELGRCRYRPRLRGAHGAEVSLPALGGLRPGIRCR